MEENELNFDKEIRNAKCIPGINDVAVEEDEKSLIILEVYYKNENEYKIVGMGTAPKSNNNMDEFTKTVYDELKMQGLNEAGAKYISGLVIDQMTCNAFMEYFVSVREKNVSYTELWQEKNRILEELRKKQKINRIRVDRNTGEIVRLDGEISTNKT